MHDIVVMEILDVKQQNISQVKQQSFLFFSSLLT